MLCVKAFSADVALISGESNSIYRTIDGGANWSSIAPQGHQGVNWQGVNGLSQLNIWVAGGTENNGEMMHSSDGGILWTSHGDSLVQDYTMISITPFDQNNIWRWSRHDSGESSDGGIEWSWRCRSLQGALRRTHYPSVSPFRLDRSGLRQHLENRRRR